MARRLAREEGYLVGISAAAALVLGLVRKNKNRDPSPSAIERLISESSAIHEKFANDLKGGKTLDLERLAIKTVLDYDIDMDLSVHSELLCP